MWMISAFCFAQAMWTRPVEIYEHLFLEIWYTLLISEICNFLSNVGSEVNVEPL
jgi:hypothetical protein